MIRIANISVPVVVLAAFAAGSACNGGGNGSIGPGNPGGTPGPIGATITIANGGVNPASVAISVGQSVTFVNNDSRGRQIASDPHPNHTDCPAINAVGLLQPGQSRPTHALTTVRTCGFHDHDDPDNANMRGQIEIR